MNDGGPAFPTPASVSCTQEYPRDDDGVIETDYRLRKGEDGAPEYGMSLRDWFAGQALANEKVCDSDSTVNCFKDNALYAYRMADAMLAEREKGRTE